MANGRPPLRERLSATDALERDRTLADAIDDLRRELAGDASALRVELAELADEIRSTRRLQWTVVLAILGLCGVIVAAALGVT